MTLDVSSLNQVDAQRILDDLDRVDASESLRRFIELGWKILEPGRAFVPGWHIDAICEHLQAVTEGEILRLLISVPPGCMKSMTTNVFWPSWEWGPRNRPDLRYVSASYSEALTIRDNRRCRNIIRSDWYQRLWGKRFQLVGDQNAKVRFDTDCYGFKIATSVGGLGTGERGDRFIIDDPHNIVEGESALKREAVIQWFTEVVPTRVNDPEVSAIVVIMQRVHERDVSGVILSEELGYEHLMLPMEYEPERKCVTSIGFEDPRADDGELLWSERMPERVVERDKKVLGEYAVASQFQQRPTPRGGGLFKKTWFQVVDAAPVHGTSVRGWDFGGGETKRSAFTAGVRIKRAFDGCFYIEDVVRLQGSPKKAEDAYKNTASQDGTDVRISIPQDPGQAGKFQANYLIRQLPGYTVRSSTETGDKTTRAEPVSSQAEAGNIKLVRGLWNEDYIEELSKFPFSEFADQVDATSRAFAALLKIPVEQVPIGPEVVNA